MSRITVDRETQAVADHTYSNVPAAALKEMIWFDPDTGEYAFRRKKADGEWEEVTAQTIAGTLKLIGRHRRF